MGNRWTYRWDGHLYIELPDRYETEAQAKAALDKMLRDAGHIVLDSEEEADKYRLLV
jgi:hypothetical protein